MSRILRPTALPSSVERLERSEVDGALLRSPLAPAGLSLERADRRLPAVSLSRLGDPRPPLAAPVADCPLAAPRLADGKLEAVGCEPEPVGCVAEPLGCGPVAPPPLATRPTAPLTV